MKKMNRWVAGACVCAALFVAGASGAYAAVSGKMSVSTSGAYVHGATYNFKYAGCKWGKNAWDGYVAGKFHVDTPKDHLNATVDGYGWVKIVQANKTGAPTFSKCIEGRDVTLHDSISLQACREHWYGDDCHRSTVDRAS